MIGATITSVSPVFLADCDDDDGWAILRRFVRFRMFVRGSTGNCSPQDQPGRWNRQSRLDRHAVRTSAASMSAITSSGNWPTSRTSRSWRLSWRNRLRIAFAERYPPIDRCPWLLGPRSPVQYGWPRVGRGQPREMSYLVASTTIVTRPTVRKPPSMTASFLRSEDRNPVHAGTDADHDRARANQQPPPSATTGSRRLTIQHPTDDTTSPTTVSAASRSPSSAHAISAAVPGTR